MKPKRPRNSQTIASSQRERERERELFQKGQSAIRSQSCRFRLLLLLLLFPMYEHDFGPHPDTQNKFYILLYIHVWMCIYIYMCVFFFFFIIRWSTDRDQPVLRSQIIKSGSPLYEHTRPGEVSFRHDREQQSRRFILPFSLSLSLSLSRSTSHRERGPINKLYSVFPSTQPYSTSISPSVVVVVVGITYCAILSHSPLIYFFFHMRRWWEHLFQA